MTIRIDELMQALGSANEAVQTLPKVKAELNSVTHELERAKALIERLSQSHQSVENELSAAKDAARSIGAERDEAQFRTLELEEKLSSITDLMGKTLGLVVPTPDKPKPEPVVVEPVAEVKAEEPELKQETTASYEYTAKTRQDDDEYKDWRRERDQNQGAMGKPMEWAPEVASPPNPFISATDAYTQVPQPMSTSEAPYTQPIADPAPEYAGQSWGNKPHDVTWLNFTSAGGERPYWLHGEGKAIDFT